MASTSHSDGPSRTVTSPTSNGGEDQVSAAQKNDAELVLNYPTPPNDPTLHLAPFRDENSAYPLVAKSCLQITQYAGSGSSAGSVDTNIVLSASALFHDASYKSTMSTCFEALTECLLIHKDRRCRILAAKTLAIAARAAYARIRHSPLVFSMRDPTVTRLEDEVGTDVATTLCVTALEDKDDGVSAAALEALGLLVLTSSTVSGSLVEDELLMEMHAIVSARVSPYTPTLRSLADEDPGVPMAELLTRVLENIIGPRLLFLIDRVFRFTRSAHVTTALPILTASLIHQIHTTPALLYGVDRTTFAKRWLELDAIGLADAVVVELIMPILQSACDGSLQYTAALSFIRLANVSPTACWVAEGSSWAASVLLDQVQTTAFTLEQRMMAVAATLIAARAVPLETKTPWLIKLVPIIQNNFPSSTQVPLGVYSAGLLQQHDVGFAKAYRRPARVGMWTEIALQFFVDGPADGTKRAVHFEAFLSSPAVSNLWSSTTSTSCREEFLLATTTAAIETARRFCVSPDGNLLSLSETSHIQEWLSLAWLVCANFSACANMGPKSVYLEEDLSLITAGLQSYVQLLQEFLFFIGLLKPACSVALRLTVNACPPHLLWDRMTDSAVLLSKLEDPSDISWSDKTTKLMDELVAREMKQGIPSHHMRLLVLALAADHWVQGRITAVRRQFEASQSNTASTLTLATNSGREILLALSPKRLLTKIFQAHIPPVDGEGKKKRDPIKKLATETVKVCVACIETISLIACDWRRRFGSSQETKHLVSIGVGLLQGKVDDTQIDDTIKSILAPHCEAAVGRIQAFYESGEVGDSSTFPASELLSHPVKTKIKPLISSTRPTRPLDEEYMRGYWMLLSRQIMIGRAQHGVNSLPLTSEGLTRQRNWLRLNIPPLPEFRDARSRGLQGYILGAWERSVCSSSAASDATQTVLAYTPKRYLRYDGEDEYQLCVILRAFNMTAVDFTEGLKLELSVAQDCEEDVEDPGTMDMMEALGVDMESLSFNRPFVSCGVVYKQELKSGNQLTWEMAFKDVPEDPRLSFIPSVVYRNVAVEPEDSGVKWTGDKNPGDASTMGSESKNGEEDFQVTNDGGGTSFKTEEPATENIRFVGEPLALSPLTGFQPCPLVFFRDAWGDINTFRFLWFRFPFHLPPIQLAPSKDDQNGDPNMRKLGLMSSLKWDGEAIPGGFVPKVWAFSNQSGSRVFGALAEAENDAGASQVTLHLRGDDRKALVRLVGSRESRKKLVDALTAGWMPLA